MNQACLLDVPGQGIPLGRGTSGNVPEGLLAILPCFTVHGPRNIEKWLAPQAQRTTVEWTQIKWQFSKDRTMHNRKQLMENTDRHRQPVQLSEREADVSMIVFSQPHHNHSYCILDCLQLLICVCSSPTRWLLQQSNLDRIRQTATALSALRMSNEQILLKVSAQGGQNSGNLLETDQAPDVPFSKTGQTQDVLVQL